MSPPPPLPYTPPDAIPGTVREQVILGPATFLIDRPANSDDLLDHPAVRAAFDADEYLPYWADLWPSARMLAKAILAEPWPPGLTALEVGCGLGLPGIAALAQGMRVIFSDYDATAVRFAAANARLNRLYNFEERSFDWRDPPADLRVDLMLASDLIYEERHVAPLVALMPRVIVPGGQAWWTDQDRKPAAELRAALGRLGWPYQTRMMRAGAPGGPRLKGTLYRIRRPA
jgi:predicted nicotinamide N-methyase